MIRNIKIPRDKVAEFCRRNMIRRLSLFGSILRDDFTPASDVDVLVEFAPNAVIGLFELYDLEQELAQILGVEKVDMNTPQGLSVYFKDQVLAEAQALYDHTCPNGNFFAGINDERHRY